MTAQIGRERTPRRRFGIAADRVRAGANPRCVRGQAGDVTGEHELPGRERDQEHRGQDAEKLDRGLPAFGPSIVLRRFSHPCRAPR